MDIQKQLHLQALPIFILSHAVICIIPEQQVTNSNIDRSTNLSKDGVYVLLIDLDAVFGRVMVLIMWLDSNCVYVLFVQDL